MKKIVGSIAALVILMTGYSISADQKNKNLIPVKVKNSIKTIGRIYVRVKSEQHQTKLTRIWGMGQTKKLKFSLDGVNTICAYETTKDPKKRYIYTIELAPNGTRHQIKLDDDELEYTYRAPNGLDQTVRVPVQYQEKVESGPNQQSQWQTMPQK